VIETLADAMLAKGVPEHVRCDNVLCREAGGALGQQVS
jgi:putative transposase